MLLVWGTLEVKLRFRAATSHVIYTTLFQPYPLNLSSSPLLSLPHSNQCQCFTSKPTVFQIKQSPLLAGKLKMLLEAVGVTCATEFEGVSAQMWGK
jgi:hypothetical protein